MQFNKHLARNLAFIVLLGILILGTVTMIRLSNNAPMIFGPESYKGIRLAELSTKVTFTDPITNQVINADSSLFLFRLMKQSGFIEIIQITLGLLLLTGFWGFLIRLGTPDKMAFISAAILALSPGFIFNFATPTLSTIPLVIFVWGLFFWVAQGNLFENVLGLLLLMGVASMGIWWAISIILVVVGYSIAVRIRAISVILVLITSAISFYFFKYSIIFSPIPFVEFIKQVIFELGGGYLSIAAAILGLIGLLTSWAKRKGIMTIYLLIILSCLQIAIFDSPGPILILFCGFSGNMLYRLFKIKWSMPPLKYTTYTFAFFTIILSTLVAVSNAASMAPDASEFNSLTALKSIDANVIFSGKEYDQYVHTIAGKNTVDYEKFSNASQIIYTSQNLKRTIPQLNNLNVTHLFLPKKLKEEYFEEGKGLLFLLRNNESFNLLSDFEGTQIWEIKS